MADAVVPEPANSVTMTSPSSTGRFSVAVTVTVPASSAAVSFAAEVVSVKALGAAAVSHAPSPFALFARTRTR